MTELLAPAGDFNRLKTAFHFGADACYVGGNSFSLRAFANNFSEEELTQAVLYAHKLNKKVYVAVNIFPKTSDFCAIRSYLLFLDSIKADGIIVTDAGIIALARELTPNLEIHLSTQANTTNGYTAKFWADLGVKRIVLARELSLDDIKAVREILPDSCEIECFVHGAMCISYSGRCLLSSYLSKRDSNRGECVQACRWQYLIREVNRNGDYLTLQEDEKGSYILNSKDLCMLRHIDELKKAGVVSFKIEGRMKTEYYVGNVVNAYRRAIDSLNDLSYNEKRDDLYREMFKVSHRGYTTGFYFGEKDTVEENNSLSASEYDFAAKVLGYDYSKKALIIEQRNKFKVGDKLEILSNDSSFNKEITVNSLINSENEAIPEAKLVQEILYLPTDVVLLEHDMLRVKRNK